MFDWCCLYHTAKKSLHTLSILYKEHWRFLQERRATGWSAIEIIKVRYSSVNDTNFSLWLRMWSMCFCSFACCRVSRVVVIFPSSVSISWIRFLICTRRSRSWRHCAVFIGIDAMLSSDTFPDSCIVFCIALLIAIKSCISGVDACEDRPITNQPMSHRGSIHHTIYWTIKRNHFGLGSILGLWIYFHA